MKYYITLALQPWSSLAANGSQLPVIFDKSLGTGFLSVFTTRTEAEKHANGAQIVEIETQIRANHENA